MNTQLIKCIDKSTGEELYFATQKEVVEHCSAGRDIFKPNKRKSAKAQVSMTLSDCSHRQTYNGWRLFKFDIDVGDVLDQLSFWKEEAFRFRSLWLAERKEVVE